MKTRVVVVADVDRRFLDRVASNDQFELENRICRSEDQVIEAARSARVLVTRSFTPVTAAVLEAAPDLELIIQGTSGLDNIDLAAASRHDIRVLGTPGANANAVAEMVIGLMISMTRGLSDYDRSMKCGDWTRSDCAERHELHRYPIGIVGIGRVGSRVANLANAFDCIVSAYDPYLDEETIRKRGGRKADTLDSLLSSSRIISLHVPLTAETRKMVGSDELALIPPGSFLINTSRGEVLDTKAVLESLTSSHLAGAALDVFESEPPSEEWPSDPRLILTPHIAGCTAEAKQEAGTRMYRELCGFYGLPCEE